MNRRKFIKSGLAAGGSLLVTSPLYTTCAGVTNPVYSTVIIARDQLIQSNEKSIDTSRLVRMLDNGMQALFDTDTSREAWTKIVKPGEVIGLKVNCLSGRGVTHPELVEAISERLLESGIKNKDIVIWDRFNTDLEEAGYAINYEKNGRRCIGNEVLGFESDFEISGSAASLVCKTLTRLCDGVINLPVLKDHGIAGITMAMKNLFGAIHNPNKYHLNVGNPYIPDVYHFIPVRKKVRLHICDAITAQYEGGPSYMPHWSWPYNSLIVSTDPVAMDYTGWLIIEQKRKAESLKSLRDVGREPKYIATAADDNHRLGINNPEKIRKKILSL